MSEPARSLLPCVTVPGGLPNPWKVFAGCKELTALSGVVPGGPRGHPRSSAVGRRWGSDSARPVQAETLCNGAGEVKNNFSGFCLGTDCQRFYRSSHICSSSDLVRFQRAQKADMKITDRELS